jgi:aldehyde dehydrogenase (NAD+)
MTTLEEAPKLESYDMLIDGERTGASDGSRFASVNPFDGKEWATAPEATEADVDRAVTAARRAFDSGDWARTMPAQRARLLRRLGALIEERSDELARVQVLENGKLLREVGPQVAALAGHCYYFSGVAETILGHTVPVSIPDTVNFTVREPIGVVAAVTPWNSPLALLMWKLAPALAAGNTVVVKPSEVTPVSTLLLADLVVEAGFPPGTFNVVTGGGQVGAWLTAHPGVDKIAFTGSTAIGKLVAKSAAERLARVSLELGGKSPNIVFADADLDNAVNGVIAGIFAATGQTCLAGSRVLVEDSVYDDFVGRLVARSRRIKLGDPMDPATEMGTLACKSQYDKVLRYLDIGRAEGATVLCGGGRPDDPALAHGLFIEPTVFGDVRNDMRIAQEEIFGPVASLIRFSTEEEAIAIANDTRFGLAAGVWTNDIRRAHRVVARLRAGTVWVNSYRRTSYAMPFGGYGESGLGRENGIEAVHEYTEVKSVWIDTGGAVQDPFNPRATARPAR